MDIIDEKVEASDIRFYFDEQYKMSLKDTTDEMKLYEALCEVLVDKNPKTRISNLEEIYKEGNDWKSRESLALEIYENGLSEDAQNLFSIAHKNNWIKSTAKGMREIYSKNCN